MKDKEDGMSDLAQRNELTCETHGEKCPDICVNCRHAIRLHLKPPDGCLQAGCDCRKFSRGVYEQELLRQQIWDSVTPKFTSNLGTLPTFFDAIFREVFNATVRGQREKRDMKNEYACCFCKMSIDLGDGCFLGRDNGEASATCMHCWMDMSNDELEAANERYFNALTHILHVEEWGHTSKPECTVEEIVDVADRALNPLKAVKPDRK